MCFHSVEELTQRLRTLVLSPQESAPWHAFRTRSVKRGSPRARSIVGSYHKVSAKYLPMYIAEAQFRYNNRHNPDIFGTAIAGL
jgi:hypothetical protein